MFFEGKDHGGVPHGAQTKFLFIYKKRVQEKSLLTRGGERQRKKNKGTHRKKGKRKRNKTATDYKALSHANIELLSSSLSLYA